MNMFEFHSLHPYLFYPDYPNILFFVLLRASFADVSPITASEKLNSMA